MASDVQARLDIRHHLIWAWGVLGFVAILVRAVVALTPRAMAPWESGGLTLTQGVVFVAWLIFMTYSEAYRGFHLKVSPRVVVRGRYLARHPRLLHVILAPLFCMGFIHATRTRLIVAYSVTAGIILLIVGVHFVPQPWRGIIDGGVVLGLACGIVSVLWFFIRALGGVIPTTPADVPAPATLSPATTAALAD